MVILWVILLAISAQVRSQSGYYYDDEDYSVHNDYYKTSNVPGQSSSNSAEYSIEGQWVDSSNYERQPNLYDAEVSAKNVVGIKSNVEGLVKYATHGKKKPMTLVLLEKIVGAPLSKTPECYLTESFSTKSIVRVECDGLSFNSVGKVVQYLFEEKHRRLTRNGNDKDSEHKLENLLTKVLNLGAGLSTGQVPANNASDLNAYGNVYTSSSSKGNSSIGVGDLNANAGFEDSQQSGATGGTHNGLYHGTSSITGNNSFYANKKVGKPVTNNLNNNYGLSTYNSSNSKSTNNSSPPSNLNNEKNWNSFEYLNHLKNLNSLNNLKPLDLFNFDALNPSNNFDPNNNLNNLNNLNLYPSAIYSSNTLNPSYNYNPSHNLNHPNSLNPANIFNFSNNYNPPNNLNPSNYVNPSYIYPSNYLNPSNNLNPFNNHPSNNLNPSNNYSPPNNLNPSINLGSYGNTFNNDNSYDKRYNNLRPYINYGPSYNAKLLNNLLINGVPIIHNNLGLQLQGDQNYVDPQKYVNSNLKLGAQSHVELPYTQPQGNNNPAVFSSAAANSVISALPYADGGQSTIRHLREKNSEGQDVQQLLRQNYENSLYGKESSRRL